MKYQNLLIEQSPQNKDVLGAIISNIQQNAVTTNLALGKGFCYLDLWNICVNHDESFGKSILMFSLCFLGCVVRDCSSDELQHWWILWCLHKAVRQTGTQPLLSKKSDLCSSYFLVFNLIFFFLIFFFLEVVWGDTWLVWTDLIFRRRLKAPLFFVCLFFKKNDDCAHHVCWGEQWHCMWSCSAISLAS